MDRSPPQQLHTVGWAAARGGIRAQKLLLLEGGMTLMTVHVYVCPENSTPNSALNTKDSRNLQGSQCSQAGRLSTHISSCGAARKAGKNRDCESKNIGVINFLGRVRGNITEMVTSVGGKRGGKGGDGNPEKGLCIDEEARCPGRSGS